MTEIASLGKDIIQSLGTMGVSFSAGTSPVVGKPGFELAEDEMELGLGIHGEPGVARAKLQPADQLTAALLTEILKHRDFGPEKRIAVMINNLGTATEMELAIMARDAMRFLEKNEFIVERLYSGTFLSSLDMAGISISVMEMNDERQRWLDAPTTAPAWPNVPKQRPQPFKVRSSSPKHVKVSTTQENQETDLAKNTKKAIEAACVALIGAEPKLTELDRITGDGDLGSNMKRASIAIRQALPTYPLGDLPATLKALSHGLRHELGGSSGPLYGVLFLRASNVLEHSPSIGLSQWAQAIDDGCRAIGELGGAKPGDRTMLDALDPFVSVLKRATTDSAHEVLTEASQEAMHGAESTSQMKPQLGRSSYLGDRVLGYPDPGAIAIAIWLRAVVDAVIGGSTAV